MKLRIDRSPEYIKRRRIATGTNVPETIMVEIDPIELRDTIRALIIEEAGEYPATFSGFWFGEGIARQCFGLTADMEGEEITVTIAEGILEVTYMRLQNAKMKAFADETQRDAAIAEGRAAQESALAEFMADETMATAQFPKEFPELDEDHPMRAVYQKERERRFQEKKRQHRRNSDTWLLEIADDEELTHQLDDGLLARKSLIQAATVKVFAPLCEKIPECLWFSEAELERLIGAPTSANATVCWRTIVLDEETRFDEAGKVPPEVYRAFQRVSRIADEVLGSEFMVTTEIVQHAEYWSQDQWPEARRWAVEVGVSQEETGIVLKKPFSMGLPDWVATRDGIGGPACNSPATVPEL